MNELFNHLCRAKIVNLYVGMQIMWNVTLHVIYFLDKNKLVLINFIHVKKYIVGLKFAEIANNERKRSPFL